ncbi:vomeronasal type-2 receptor 116-like, partial [Sigmodon hispidus]
VRLKLRVFFCGIIDSLDCILLLKFFLCSAFPCSVDLFISSNFFSVHSVRGRGQDTAGAAGVARCSWCLLSWLTPKNLHLIFSLYFAMEEINRSPFILPNISLLVNIKCNLFACHQNISSSRSEHFPNYYCKKQRKYLVVFTGPLWRMSAICAPLLYISRTPALTYWVYYGYFNPLLNAQEQFPYLHQMSHKDTSLALAMVSLVIHFKWNWVGMIISDDDLGLQFLAEWRGEIQRNIVCLAFVTMITTDPILYFKMLNKYYDQVMMSTAKVVIVYGDRESLLQWNFVLWQSLDIWRIWVSVSQFDMITVRGNFLLNSPHGTLIFSHHHSEVSGFKHFLQTVHPLNYSNEISLAKVWWSYFKCSLPLPDCNKLNNCPTKTLHKWLFRTPSGMSMSDTTYNLYNAVYAVAHSIHELLLQQVDRWSKNVEMKLEFESWKMFSLLKNMEFVNPAGNLVSMNQKVKLDTEYDIFYIMNFPQHFGLKIKIGRFSRHFPNYRQLYMSDEMIEWATDIKEVSPSICSKPCSPGLRKSPQQEKAVCCFDCNPCPENEISNMTNMDECVKCPYDQYANKYKTHCLKKNVTFLAYEDPLGISLACLALCFSALTTVVLCVFLKHQDTPIVKANNRALSYVLLISLIFSFLCPLLYIGHPHTITCILQQITFSIVFTMATSTVLAKTVTVVLAFRVTVPDRRMRSLLVLGAPNYIIPICTIIQIIFCGIWVGTSPPFVDADVHMEHGHIIIVCNKGSVISFYCVLGYLGSLALASFTVSFLARNLPDTFNEAKFLTFSMLVFCSVWITFLAVYHSTKGKALVAMEVFCILASSAGLFFCIFAPKCYFILLRPKINYSYKNVFKTRTSSLVCLYGEIQKTHPLMMNCYMSPYFIRGGLRVVSGNYLFDIPLNVFSLLGTQFSFLTYFTMILSVIFAFLVLKPHFVFCKLTDPVCFFRVKDEKDTEGDKDIDCFFSIYTGDSKMKIDYFHENLDKQLTPRNIHLIFTLYFAMEEINRNPHILPNISLLVNIKCDLMADQIKLSVLANRSINFANYYCKNKRKYLIVLSGPMWRLSSTYGPLHYISRIPELYYGHFQPLLSVHEQFPYLCQISPKDTSLTQGMVYLMIYFRWNWVGVIISDDDSGIQFLSELRADMQIHLVCLAFLTFVTNDDKLYFKMFQKYYNQIMMSSAKVVIVYGDKDSNLQWNFILWRSVKMKRIWVSVSQFDRTITKGSFFLDSFYGTLIYSHHNFEISGFKQFMQTLYPSNYTNIFSYFKIWWIYFNCSLSTSNCKILKNCSTESILEWLLRYKYGMSMSDSSYNLYNAVYAVAYSLHKMLLQKIEFWSENAWKGLEFDVWQMLSLLKKIQFVNPAGDLVDMNQKSKQNIEYDIFYITDFQKHFGLKVKIGKFSRHFPNNQQLYISEEMIEWATDFRKILPSICSRPCSPGHRKSPLEGKPVCCFECNPCTENEISNMTNDMDHCVKCPDDQYANTKQTYCLKKVVTFLAYEEPLGMSLAGLALFFSFLTTVVLAIFLKYQDTPIVKANNQVLSYVLLISLIFCFLCPFLYIGYPHMATCVLQQTTFGIAFTIATSSVLAKTLTVVLAFKAHVPDRRLRWLLASSAPKFIIPVCTVIQMILSGIWLVTSPPFVDADIHTEHGYILIVCNKGSVLAFHCALGYLGFLALTSFTVAFLARNLPDTFNEAKYLTFSMLVFCTVWITFLPVYQSSKRKAILAMEVFCIFASSAGLFLCIFAPKCYIILFKPEKNCFQEGVYRQSNGEADYYKDILERLKPLRKSTNEVDERLLCAVQMTPRNIHLIFTLYFAMEEINRNPHILPNISLLVNIKCDLMADQIKLSVSANRSINFPNYSCKNQRKYLIVLSGPLWRLSATHGPLHYISSTPEVNLLNQLYYGHFQPLLSVQEQFPYLCQISPKDTSLTQGMVYLMIYFRWNWVGVIISDDDSGIQFLSELRAEMQIHLVCLAFLTIVTNDDKLYFKMFQKYYNQIMMSSAKAVIVYGDKDSNLQRNFIQWRFSKMKRIWISMSQFDRIVTKGGFFLDSFYGTLIYSHHNFEISGLKQFMQTLYPSNYTNIFSYFKLWWIYFNCSLSTSNCKTLKNCSTESILEWLFRYKYGMSMSDSSYNLYNAVYAVAYSLHKMLLQKIGLWSENAWKGLEFDAWQMLSLLKKIQFVNPVGDIVDMNQKSKQNIEYDIFYITDFQKHFGLKVKIGKFSRHLPNNQPLYISEEMIEWATDFRQILPSICSRPCSPGHRKSPLEGKPVCCFECNPCTENEISNMT